MGLRTETTPHGGRPLTRRAWAKVSVGAAVGVGASALAACGLPGGESPAAKQSGPVTIVYMSNLPETHPEGDARLFLLNEFAGTNSLQISIDTSNAKASTSNDKLKALAAGGTPPDLFYVSSRFTAEFYLASMTIEIDTELNKEKDWAKQRADIFPAMFDSSTWVGKLVGIPGYTNNEATIYNIGLLQQTGVALPKQGWTWDDFRTVAVKFVRPGLIPLSMAWAGEWRHWLGTMGARIMTKDAKRVTADTPEMQEVLEYWLDLQKRGIIIPQPDGKEAVNETYKLAKNDTAFEMQGPYRIPTLRQSKAPDFGVIHTPIHPVKKQIMAANGGHNMVVFKDIAPAKRRAAALTAKWMNEPHAQAQMCIKATSIPVSKATMETKELQDYLKTDPQFKAFVDLAPYGWRWPTFPSYDKFIAAVDGGVAAIMRQEIGVKAGLAKMQQEAQVALDADVALMK